MKFSRWLFAGATLLTLGLVAQAQVPGVNSTLSNTFTYVGEGATYKPTFSIATTVTAASAASDVFELRGSATKLVKIRRIRINGAATTAANMPILLVKRSALDDAGSTQGTQPTVAVFDTGNLTGQVAATAIGELFTVNPVENQTFQMVEERLVGLGNFTTTQPALFDLTWGLHGSVPVLRGAAQTLSINLGGSTFSGNVLFLYVEWTEE